MLFILPSNDELSVTMGAKGCGWSIYIREVRMKVAICELVRMLLISSLYDKASTCSMMVQVICIR